MTDTPVDDLKPSFRSDVTVELVKHSAADSDVLWAARVSTAGEQSLEELQKEVPAGLIEITAQTVRGLRERRCNTRVTQVGGVRQEVAVTVIGRWSTVRSPST